MIISIAGTPGSGKTTVGKRVATQLGFTFYSVGGLRGKLAQSKGITIDELNKLGEEDRTTDTSVDDYQRELGKTEDNFVIEGRLSWHFIPNSLKVFLTCDERVAAERIYNVQQTSRGADRQDEKPYANVEDAQRAIHERVASDERRYAKYYGLSSLDHGQFDLVIDTTNLTPETVIEKILDRAK